MHIKVPPALGCWNRRSSASWITTTMQVYLGMMWVAHVVDCSGAVVFQPHPLGWKLSCKMLSVSPGYENQRIPRVPFLKRSTHCNQSSRMLKSGAVPGLLETSSCTPCYLGSTFLSYLLGWEFNLGKDFLKIIWTFLRSRRAECYGKYWGICGFLSQDCILVLLFSSGCTSPEGLSCVFSICWAAWKLVMYVTTRLEEK